MAAKKILIWPNNRLFDVSKEVEYADINTEAFKELVKDLKDTLGHYHGVGLSAIQIGVPLGVFVMQTETGIQEFVNPYVMDFIGEKAPVKEGCLSIPGVYEDIERYPEVIISSLNTEDGSERLWSLEGIEAQCAQHEIEHFEGKTLMDRFGQAKRMMLKKAIKKALIYDPAYQL